MRTLASALIGILIGVPINAETFPDQLLWGDTHVHSNNSPDAYFLGNRSLTPTDAYNFAKGQPLTIGDAKFQLNRPLDFLVVADHAEYLGVFPSLDKQKPEVLATELGSRWYKYIVSNNYEAIFDEFVASLHTKHHRYQTSPAFDRLVWHKIIRASDTANEPNSFTALTGFEWTSMPGGNNLHRVVIFADDFDRVSQVQPYSQLDSDKPEDLWAYLAHYEQTTGGRAFAIPHNANLSNGLMFSLSDSAGKPISKSYAETRRRWEPVMEATQIKGDGESHPKLSPQDPYADYENWDQGNVAGTQRKSDEMLQFEYARSALKNGMAIAEDVGVNPYAFGMIGSSDSHTSMASVEEKNYIGKFILNMPKPGRWKENTTGGASDTTGEGGLWPQVASGIAAVWSRANTREAIFEAFLRKEVYATTGPRIALRLFAGFEFAEQDLQSADVIRSAYRKGVPMGGELNRPSRKEDPLTLLIFATQDPEGNPLERVQVIKGWVNHAGKVQERIHDVRIAPGKGSSELNTFWRDPDFDPTQRSFYYVRVLETESPRWTAFDKIRFNEEMPAHIPMTTRERAYSSPIWYTP